MDRTGRVEAVVHAGALETPYVRAGRGRPVLLIHDPAVGAAVWDRFFDRLARSFTVVAPRPDPGAWPKGGGGPGSGPAEGDEPAALRWLRELIEGLGWERPGLVVGPALGEALDGAGPRGGDWIGRLVILSPWAAPGVASPPPAGVAGGPAAGGPDAPTLRIALREWPVEAACETAGRFLEGGRSR